MMELLVENQQKKLRLNLPKISQIAKTILRRQKVKSATISIVFVTSQKIRALNQKYLKRNYATDVLAFNLSETKRHLVGDVIISTDAVIKNARSFGVSKKQELALYVIHGLLHLLGYDDHTNKDIKKMRAKEEQLLKQLGSKVKTLTR